MFIIPRFEQSVFLVKEIIINSGSDIPFYKKELKANKYDYILKVALCYNKLNLRSVYSLDNNHGQYLRMLC